MTTEITATAPQPPSHPVVNNGKDTRFKAGNPGRPRGSKNKFKASDYAEARTEALKLVPEVWSSRSAHIAKCTDEGDTAPARDCQMCRYYHDLVMHYAYGKPPQRHELIQATLKADTEALAKSLGLDETAAKAAVDEVDRAYKALRASQ